MKHLSASGSTDWRVRPAIEVYTLHFILYCLLLNTAYCLLFTLVKRLESNKAYHWNLHFTLYSLLFTLWRLWRVRPVMEGELHTLRFTCVCLHFILVKRLESEACHRTPTLFHIHRPIFDKIKMDTNMEIPDQKPKARHNCVLYSWTHIWLLSTYVYIKHKNKISTLILFRIFNWYWFHVVKFICQCDLYSVFCILYSVLYLMK